MTKQIVGVLVLSGGLLVWSVTPASTRNQPHEESARLIESIQGPALYSAYCAVCHGKDGRGAGPMANSLKSKTPDLTAISKRNGGKFPLAKVEKIISGEEQLPGGHGVREMPLWGPVFSQIAWDQDLGRIRVYNLAKHLESMQVR